jgi:NADH-quinone oxidoreductase subunit J
MRSTSFKAASAAWAFATLLPATALAAPPVAASPNESSLVVTAVFWAMALLTVVSGAGVAQVLIYVGGVLVLILFAVMLTSRLQQVKFSNPGMGMLPATLASVATTALLIFVAVAAPWRVTSRIPPMQRTAEAIGDLLLNRYLLPFEIASVVLLATLIGSVVVARKEIKPD